MIAAATVAITAGSAAAATASAGFGVSAVVLPACVISSEPALSGGASTPVSAKCTVETPHSVSVEAAGSTGRDLILGSSASDSLAPINGGKAQVSHIPVQPDASSRQIVVTISY